MIFCTFTAHKNHIFLKIAPNIGGKTLRYIFNSINIKVNLAAKLAQNFNLKDLLKNS